MIRPLFIKPTITKPIAFAGGTSNETTTIVTGPRADDGEDINALKQILKIDADKIDSASSTQNIRKIDYCIVVRDFEGKEFEVKTKGKSKVEVSSRIHTQAPDAKAIEIQAKNWNVWTAASDNPEVHQLVADVCNHVRGLYRQVYKQNNSLWQRMRNLLRR